MAESLGVIRRAEALALVAEERAVVVEHMAAEGIVAGAVNRTFGPGHLEIQK